MNEVKITEAVKNRLPSVLVAISSSLAVVGVQVTETEVNATVETVLQLVAAGSALYAAVRVWVDKIQAKLGG